MVDVNPDVQGDVAGTVDLPSGVIFGTMGVSRDGSDLRIETADGQEIRVKDYFAQEPPSDLIGANGERIAGHVVATLAGPETSDITLEEISAEPIGQIHSMSGNVYVVHADGVRVEARVNMPLFQNDVLETLDDGALGVILSDETSFAMSENGVMILDELIYDPVEQEGSLSLFMLRGMATVTSGMISKTDPDGMVIDTPVGTIGIRGTQIGIDATQGDLLSITMMEEADGYIGEVTFINSAGSIVMNQAYQVIGSVAGKAPEFLPSINLETVAATFGHTLSHLPLIYGTANDYSTQEPEGGGELEPEPESETQVVPDTEDEDTAADLADEETPESSVTQVVTEELAAPLQTATLDISGTATEPTKPEPGAGVETLTAPEDRPAEAPPEEDRLPDYGIALNYPPIAFPDTVSVSEDQTLSGQLLATDADQDALTFALAENGDPANGSVTLNPDGTYVYTPAPDFSGTDEFTFSVSDGQGGVTQSTISVQVLPVAATPALAVSDISVTGSSEPGIVIKGSKQDDELVGTSGDDQITGKGGDDVIIGDTGVVGVIPAIPLDIQVGLEEGEALENLQISLQGVPAGASLSAGTDEGGGVWSLTADDLNGLSMSLPENHEGDFSLVVEAIHTDTNSELDITDTATNSAVINVSVVVDGGHDVINAGAGDDIVDGGAGADDLRGDAGDDVLYGGAGSDVIEGGKGDDVIVGGEGDDILYGDQGFDQFIFGLDAGEDIIADYKLGEQIRFEGPEFSATEPQITGNDNGGVSILFGDHNVEVTVDNVDLSQQSYTITPSDDGLVVVFDDAES